MRYKTIHTITRKGRGIYIRKWIIDKIPPHYAYVEPFGGASYVLHCKPPHHVKIYDIDGDLIKLFEQAAHKQYIKSQNVSIHI